MCLLHNNSQKAFVANLNEPGYKFSTQITILIKGKSNMKNANGYRTLKIYVNELPTFHLSGHIFYYPSVEYLISKVTYIHKRRNLMK